MDVKDLATAVAESTLSALERVRFLNLCEPRSADALAADRDRVEGHLSLMRAAHAINSLVDVELAEGVAGSLMAMLEMADGLAYEERRLLAGAVEYYVLTGDNDDDLASPVGMVDDARVTNATAEALGRSDLVVPVAE